VNTTAPARWFRLHAEFAVDPKVQMLSEADQRRFIMLLCLRCCNGDETLHDETVTFQLRISNDEWNATKATLISRNLITQDNKPVSWDKRQYASDSSTERVKKHRDNKKQPCNVSVTAPESENREQRTEADKNKTASPLTREQIERYERKKAEYQKNKGGDLCLIGSIPLST
jgi:hypothetical protein